MTGFLVFLVGAYVIGSINVSILVTRLVRGVDLRTLGSGNPGASNVYRSVGKGWALLVLLLDLGRGFGVAFLSLGLWSDPWLAVAPLLSLVLGNTLPLFHGFRGGKGVATLLGIYLALDWLAALLAGALWITLAVTTRRASVGSMVALGLFPLALWWRTDELAHVAYAGLMFLFVLFSHRKNIGRLFKGQEPRLG